MERIAFLHCEKKEVNIKWLWAGPDISKLEKEEMEVQFSAEGSNGEVWRVEAVWRLLLYTFQDVSGALSALHSQ